MMDEITLFKLNDRINIFEYIIPFTGIFVDECPTEWLRFLVGITNLKPLEKYDIILLNRETDEFENTTIIVGGHTIPVAWAQPDMLQGLSGVSEEDIKEMQENPTLYFLYGGSGNNEVVVEKAEWDLV